MHFVRNRNELTVYETEELKVVIARVNPVFDSDGYTVKLYDYLFSADQLIEFCTGVRNYTYYVCLA